MSGAPSTASQTVCPIRPAAPATATRIITRPPPPAGATRARCRGGTTSSSGPMPAALSRAGSNSSAASACTSSMVTASTFATTSSIVSSGRPASSDAPRRFIRAAVDSSASTMRPFTFSFDALELRHGRGVLDAPPQLVADDRHRRVDVVRPRADVQADLARVREQAAERVDAVRQAPAFADLLEQPRRRRAAEDLVEHPQREAAVVVARRSRGPPRHRWYCSVSFAMNVLRAASRAAGGPNASYARGRGWDLQALGQEHERVVVDRARPRRSRSRPARSARRGTSAARRRDTDAMTSSRPMIARPSGWSPKTASPSRSKILSCGSSSYIAISSQTISRSLARSSSSSRGAKTISCITSNARGRWTSSIRE